MSDDRMRCTECRKGATWKGLNREPWLMVVGPGGSFDVGVAYCCPDCWHDLETIGPGVYVVWAVGETLRWARFQPVEVVAP